LLLVRAHLLGAEAVRRRGQGSAAARLAARVQRIRMLPPLMKARAALLSDLAQQTASEAAIVERHITSTGAAAFALLVPGESRCARGSSTDLVRVLELCQRAEEDAARLAAIGAHLCQRLDARSVVFASRVGDHWERLGDDRGRLDGMLASRVEALGTTIAPHLSDGAIQGAAPVRYGGRVIAVLMARWSGAHPMPSHAADTLTLTAVAAAPACVAAMHGPRAAEPLHEILGVSAAMARVRESIANAAATPFPVLIEGESGVGKELVAQAIHRGSLRRDRGFCALNCAALPDELVESELFGHARGAFTGADCDRAGVFEAAHLGTVFLDEIGELSARAQAKVLRTLQEGDVRRVGDTGSRHVDVRVVAATNRDLHREATAGRFRIDLFYRLDVIRIVVPPLRDRAEDIVVLAEHFWRDAAEKTGSRAVLAATTRAALTRYHWPGNVRELQNVLCALAARSPRRGVIESTALPSVFEAVQASTSRRLDVARQTFETQFVRAALTRAGGHHGRAATDLGVTRQGLAKLMTRLGLERREDDRDRKD
jgi:DNA-binding NtrC family response regulator